MKALYSALLGATLVCTLLAPRPAAAHSASDAFLTLDTAADASVQGQWDIALRDLDFVLGLDDDGNGEITWGEVRRHQAAIAHYALAHLTLLGDGRVCPLTLTKQLIDNHADGAYAALFFRARCGGAKTTLTVDYRLFFDIDPSHRAILVAHQGEDTATAVLSPQNAKVKLKLMPPAAGPKAQSAAASR